jgi:hypothetical protein
LEVFGHFSKMFYVVELSHFQACFELTTPTLCNQLLSRLYADIHQTLHSYYGHIEDVYEMAKIPKSNQSQNTSRKYNSEK